MLLLVLILVLIAFGLLVIALLSSSVLWAWVSVAVSVSAAAVLLVDWLLRRSAVKAGSEAAGSEFEPVRSPAPTADVDPVTEVIPVIPSSGPGVPGSSGNGLAGASPASGGAFGARFDQESDGQQTVVIPVPQPPGSTDRPSGARPGSAPSSGISSRSVTESDAERRQPVRAAGAANAVAPGTAGEAAAVIAEPQASDPTPAATVGRPGSNSPDRADTDDAGSLDFSGAVDPEPRNPAIRDPEPGDDPGDPEPGDPDRTHSGSVESSFVPRSSVPGAVVGSGVADVGSGAVPRDGTLDDAPPRTRPAERAGPQPAGVFAPYDPDATVVGSRTSPPADFERMAPDAGAAPVGAAFPSGYDGEPPEEPCDARAAALVAGLENEVVVVDEQPRYHLASCPSLVTKPVIPLPVREAVELGFTPCGWCTPDRILAHRHPAAAR